MWVRACPYEEAGIAFQMGLGKKANDSVATGPGIPRVDEVILHASLDL